LVGEPVAVDSVRLSLVRRRRADAAWLNRSDGRAPSRPDRVLRPLRGAAPRCRSGGAHPRGVGGRRQRRRGRPGGGRHLRRARERRARVHEVDARALSTARRGRAAGPQATCGRLTQSAFADSRQPAAPGKAGWRSPGTPGVVGEEGGEGPDPPQPAPTWLPFAAQPAGATDGSRACADRGSQSCASGRCRGERQRDGHPIRFSERRIVGELGRGKALQAGGFEPAAELADVLPHRHLSRGEGATSRSRAQCRPTALLAGAREATAGGRDRRSRPVAECGNCDRRDDEESGCDRREDDQSAHSLQRWRPTARPLLTAAAADDLRESFDQLRIETPGRDATPTTANTSNQAK
jgi:hypothetical protein